MDMLNFFKPKIKKGSLYAVLYGTHKGKFLTYMKKGKKGYQFLMTPDMLNMEVPFDEFDKGVECGILDFVEIVPSDVKKTVEKQFQFNVGDTDRIYHQ
jgi:hypothetical protein